jgi:hypothetical protein
MKRTWDIEELVEHFTLVSSDVELLGNKTGATRIGADFRKKGGKPDKRAPDMRK